MGCKDIYLLNHFRMSSPAALRQALATLPRGADDDRPPETRLRYCRILHTARQRGIIRREWGRAMGSVTVHNRKWFVIQQWGKETNLFQREERRGKAGKVSCVCPRVGDSGCICEQVNRQEAGGERKKSAVLHLWCDSSLKLFEKRQPVWFFSPLFSICFPPLSMTLRLVWHSSPWLRWLEGGEEVTRSDRWQWRRCWGEEGKWVEPNPNYRGDVTLISQQIKLWLVDKMKK